MRIYRNKFDVIVVDLEGEKEISFIHVETAGVLVVGEAIRPTKRPADSLKAEAKSAKRKAVKVKVVRPAKSG